MRFSIAALAAALSVSSLGACDKGGGGSGGTPMRDLVVAGWRKDGLTVSALTPDKTGTIGPDCASGTVNGVEVVLCSFKTPDEAKAAESKAWGWIGSTTGAAAVKGTLVLAAADRAKADPSGKTIDTLTKSFKTE